jgi:alkylhydroperoxidase/carboxymuconolactone decarboxylase family protein YurZ
MNTRLQQLTDLLKDEPNDAFLNYAIIIEQFKDNEQALIESLKSLTQKFPEYAPPFRKLGEIFAEKEEEEQAIHFLNLALKLAENEGDEKAIKELKSKIDWLNF